MHRQSLYWKFFQMRQLTKPLDGAFDDDYDELKIILNKQKKTNPNFGDPLIDMEGQIIERWDQYKQAEIKRIINDTHNSTNPEYKMCICDFIKQFEADTKFTMEVWIKIAYDIFNDELDGSQLRHKFWNYLRRRAAILKDALITKQWPLDWEYIQDESCLCIEIVKLYEQYAPIRIHIAQNLNTLCDGIVVDIRRMPILIEDKGLEIDYSRKSWLPRMIVCSPQMLERVYYANNIFTHQILRFVIAMKKILLPFLQYLDEKGEAGSVINVFGDNHEFMFELIYSLKVGCGLAMRTTEGSLKIQKTYKGNDQKSREDLCRIILTSMSQSDINEEIMKDIYLNVQSGYTAFRSDVRSYIKPSAKLVIMVSERKLNIRMPRVDDIIYHEIADHDIDQLMNSIDYKFLIYYSNLLFGKVMVVQQMGGQRKPFYSLMMLMWAYLLPIHFSRKNPALLDDEIYKLIGSFEEYYEMQNLEIDLDDHDSSEISNLSYEHEQIITNDIVKIQSIGKKVKILKFEDD